MNIIHPCPHALSHDCPLRPEKPVFGFDGCFFHANGRVVYLEAGHELAITEVLWRNFGKDVKHEAFYSAVYGALPESDLPDDPTNVIKVKVCHARRKMREVGLAIKSVHKIGYRMEPLQ